jgi:hypothetical protein
MLRTRETTLKSVVQKKDLQLPLQPMVQVGRLEIIICCKMYRNKIKQNIQREMKIGRIKVTCQ